MFVISFLIALNTGGRVNADDNVMNQFEARYKEWKTYISRPEVMAQSIAGSRFKCSQFREIVKLGLPALPYIIQKMRMNPKDQLLWKAIEEIAKVKIRGKYDKEKKRIIFPDLPDLEPGENVYLYWWRKGRKQTPQLFDNFYSEWQGLKKEGKEKEAKIKYQRIKELGIAALPYMVEYVEQGDSDLINAISELTEGAITESTKPSECVDWWNKNEEKWTIPADTQD